MEVALAGSCIEVEARTVRVSVVLAGFAKMIDWELVPLVLVLVRSRLLKAEVPTMVPERICGVVPFSVVVPEPAVKVPSRFL